MEGRSGSLVFEVGSTGRKEAASLDLFRLFRFRDQARVSTSNSTSECNSVWISSVVKKAAQITLRKPQIHPFAAGGQSDKIALQKTEKRCSGVISQERKLTD